MNRLVARCAANSVTTSQRGESLVFTVRAAIPGMKIPVYEYGDDGAIVPKLEDGVQVFKIPDEDYLRRCVSLFDGGQLDKNHEGETDFGDLTNAYYDEGLCLSAVCSDPDDVAIISSGKYNGWSVQGDFVETPDGDALKITKLSLLTTKNPSCPSNKCKTLEMALAAWDGGAATDRLIQFATDDEGNIQKGKISKYFLEVSGDGTKKGDYGWPVGDIKDGSPAYDEAGCMAAYKAASGARGAAKDAAKIKKIKSIYKSEGWELPAGLQGKAAETVDPRDDWNNWGNFSIKGDGEEGVNLHVYLPDIDFGEGNTIKSMDVVDPAKFKIIAQYVVNSVLNVASGNQGAVVMASEVKPGEPGTEDPFASIKAEFGIENDEALKELLKNGKKYSTLKTDYDAVKGKLTEKETAFTELETRFGSMKEAQRQRDLEESRKTIKEAYVPGLWEGELEEEVDGEKVKVAKLDRLAEQRLEAPDSFFLKNKTFALAERALEPKKNLKGSAASTETDEIFQKRREAVDKNMQRAGR